MRKQRGIYEKEVIVLLIVSAFSVPVILGAAVVIRASANGHMDDDATKIPYRKAGLALGCSKLLSGGRTNLFFPYRVDGTAVAKHIPRPLCFYRRAGAMEARLSPLGAYVQS